MKTYVLLGHMTFLNEVIDGEDKAIIHEITEIKSFDTVEEAEIFGEEGLDRCEGYLIPQVYGGAIEVEY